MMLPQLWQLWRTRSADDLSHVFLAFYNVGERCLLLLLLLQSSSAHQAVPAAVQPAACVDRRAPLTPCPAAPPCCRHASAGVL